MTIVADHLDNAGLNAIAKGALLESMYFYNEEKTPLQWTSRLSCRHFLHTGLFCLILYFLVIVLKCVQCL